jgi:DNA mismatch endonuclease (patch repair protein)
MQYLHCLLGKSLQLWLSFSIERLRAGLPLDRISKARRSWNMSRIRGADTAPEILVRSILHRLGYRFRIHSRTLPGRPDIVLAKYRTVVFVHGCFWHRHPNCKFAYTPKSRKKFWQSKFEKNIARDATVQQLLRQAGWRVLTIWECWISNEDNLAKRLRRFLS